MTVYVRRFNCSVCGKQVFWDDKTQKLRCGCGSFKASFVNLSEFIKMPKYDRYIWKEKLEIPIDCAKYVAGNMLYICDRNSFVKTGEDPRLIASFVYYPYGDKNQLKLAVKGNFHMETISYNAINPDDWTERMWIHLDSKALEKLIAYLQKDPSKLHNWV